MKWNDLKNLDSYVFDDGSKMTQLHQTHTAFCYRFWLKKHPKHIEDNSLTVSADHYILCQTRLNKRWEDYLASIQETQIPVVEDLHVIPRETAAGVVFDSATKAIKSKPWRVEDSANLYWLSAKSIFTLLMNKKRVRPVGNEFTKWEAVGERKCFCISTDTGRYKCCGVVNSNSVTLRDIVFHSLTHSDDIKLALIDLKRSEFEYLKGTNGIVGVGNTPREAAEILRLAREIMYKRNEENAKRQLSNFADWQPQQPTDKIKIFNTEFPENTSFDVEVAGEKKKMTAKEILQFMN